MVNTHTHAHTHNKTISMRANTKGVEENREIRLSEIDVERCIGCDNVAADVEGYPKADRAGEPASAMGLGVDYLMVFTGHVGRFARVCGFFFFSVMFVCLGAALRTLVKIDV